MDNYLSDNVLTSAEWTGAGGFDGSSWWRASSYEVIGGTHIVPTADADIDVYDPLEDQQLFWGGRRKMGNVAPYVALADLDLSDRGAICSWYSEYGPLGILHHRIVDASLWPVWVPFRLPDGIRSVKPQQMHLGHGLTVRPVVAEAAHSPQTFSPKDYYGRPLTQDELGPAIQQSSALRDRLERPGARLLGRDGAEREAHVTEGVVQFFPRIEGVSAWTAWHARNSYPHLAEAESELRSTQAKELAERLAHTQIPDPRSREFLQAYGEPLHLFRQWTHVVRNILDFWDRSGAPDAHELGPVPKAFETLLRSVSPGARIHPSGDEGQWQPTWSVPSLLSALGVMILQEIPLGKANIRRCAECGKIMTAAHPKRRYCNPTCRGTFNQRKWRERKKEKDDE